MHASAAPCWFLGQAPQMPYMHPQGAPDILGGALGVSTGAAHALAALGVSTGAARALAALGVSTGAAHAQAAFPHFLGRGFGCIDRCCTCPIAAFPHFLGRSSWLGFWALQQAVHMLELPFHSCSSLLLITSAHRDPDCSPLLLTTPAHRSCSSLLLITSAHHSCSPLLLITPAHHSCSSLLLITSAHRVPDCSPLLLTTPAHHSCSSLLLITPTHHLCSSLLLIAPAHHLCSSRPRLLTTPAHHLCSSLLLIPSHKPTHRVSQAFLQAVSGTQPLFAIADSAFPSSHVGCVCTRARARPIGPRAARPDMGGHPQREPL